jgi:hypothetical protein
MHRRPSPVLILLASFVLVVSACGDDSDPASSNAATTPSTAAPTTTPPAEGDPVLVYEATGGCQMMGPNCPKFVVYPDGTVEIYRAGEQRPAEVTATIDPAALAAFLTVAEAEDFDALVERLPPGTCQACVDGVDILLDVKLNGQTESLNSTVVAFDEREPFFAALTTLIEQVSAVGELPIEQR